MTELVCAGWLCINQENRSPGDFLKVTCIGRLALHAVFWRADADRADAI